VQAKLNGAAVDRQLRLKASPALLAGHLFAKRLERSRFVWPSTVTREGTDRISTTAKLTLACRNLFCAYSLW
jgi:hypothetical protein